MKFCFPNNIHTYLFRLKYLPHMERNRHTKCMNIRSRKQTYLSVLLTYFCVSRLHLHNLRKAVNEAGPVCKEGFLVPFFLQILFIFTWNSLMNNSRTCVLCVNQYTRHVQIDIYVSVAFLTHRRSSTCITALRKHSLHNNKMHLHWNVTSSNARISSVHV
jgi:hypothetical protein